MAKLAEDYQAKGIAIIGINSNVAEDAAAVKAHAAEHKLSFPILKDPGNKIADRFGAAVTPEAYFISADNKLLYHGRIDNSRNASQDERNDQRNELDAALAGKAIEKTEAKAFGCTIKRA
jgi:peroxiredoxin